jgi:hypothetical protein
VFIISNKIYRILSPPLFTVSIRDGTVKLKRGKVARAVLSEFETITKQQGILKGAVYGIKRGSVISLEFSGNISKEDQQRFRNVWVSRV